MATSHRIGAACLRLVLPLALAALPCAQALAAPSPEKNAQIFMYKGADREQKLVAAAKAEGTLTWYTSISTSEVRPMAEAFEKKYGIKVKYWVGPNEQLVQRAVTEARSRRHTFDVLETNATENETLNREKLTAPYYTPYDADYPTEGIPAGRPWKLSRMNYLVVAYNTNKVKREELPQTVEGFADPKWARKLAIEAGDWDWMTTIVRSMGEDKGKAFFQKLAANKPELRKGHPLMAQLVGAGEIPVGLTVFLPNILSAMEQGTPIGYVPVQPVLGLPFGISVAKSAPHPHAALLFAEFFLSPEGQKILGDLGRLPASKKAKNDAVDFPYTMLDVDAALRESAQREKAWNALFLNK